MKRDHYIFDNTRNEFIKVTNSTGRIVGKILKYFAVTASLAIVYYVVFSLVISTVQAAGFRDGRKRESSRGRDTGHRDEG